MELLLVLLGTAGGAIAGALASIAASTQIARGNELGRVQEEARQRMLATLREWRAQVLADRTDASWAAAMGSEYLSRDRGLQLAEVLERDLVHAPERITERTREHITVLVGPVDAHVARMLNPIPLEDRNEYWRQVSYLQARAEIGDTADQHETGLFGQARDAPLIGDHVKAIVAELDNMTAILSNWKAGLLRRR